MLEHVAARSPWSGRRRLSAIRPCLLVTDGDGVQPGDAAVRSRVHHHVSTWAGHADLSMAERVYVHPSAKDLEQGRAALNILLGGAAMRANRESS